MFGSPLYSFLLAQMFGLTLVILAIIFLSRADYYRAMILEMQSTDHAMFIGALLGLFLGIFLVLIHNIWVLHPRVIVTIMCWMILMKSVLWLAAPERMMRLAKHICNGRGYYVCIVCMMSWGMLLMAKGSYLYILKVTADGH